MTQDILTAALIVPATFAAASAIFPFGKRKPEPAPQSDPVPFAEEEPIEPNVNVDDPYAEAADTEGETLPVLATFSAGEDLYIDRNACEQVWDALALPVRTEEQAEPSHFFALSAFDPAPAGRDAVALTACKLAQDATQRGYSVLLVDADVSRRTLHRLPLFAPREGTAESAPAGFTDFLRGDTTRLEPLLKLAWRTEGLLLLPAGTTLDSDDSLTGNATWERLLRLAGPLAEIVLVVAPPVFATEGTARNEDMLPKMDGVLIVYPSSFSAAGDTEALEKMEAMSVPQVGAIVAPPVSFDDEDADSAIPAPEPTPFIPVTTEADPVLSATGGTEPVVPDPVVDLSEQATVSEPVSAAEPEPDFELPSVVVVRTEQTEEAPQVEPVLEAIPEPAEEQEAEHPVMEATPIPEPRIESKPEAVRPSFLSPPMGTGGERPRGDARRAVPIDNVPVYNTAPARQSRPVPANPAVPQQQQANETMPTLNNPSQSGNAYRPDVAIELIPTAGTTPLLTLRADVGGTGTGPVLLLEVRTLAAEAKRLRADNPGSHAGAHANAPLLVLESLTGTTAPEDATTLRLVVRESNAEGAATLLEAVLETPDALRIKSGKPTQVGVPPVRFEVTTEPDDTARFRATIPPLDNTPSLFVDLERTTTEAGRSSRVVLRIA